MSNYGHTLARSVASGREKEAQFMALLIFGRAQDLVSMYTCTQIMKSETVLPAAPSKPEVLERLNVSVTKETKKDF
jgi:hypothetical protein